MEGDSVTTPRFFAHSHPDEPAPGAKWHTLGDHLRDAANLAEAFAGEASATLRSAAASRLTEVTRSAALVHDLGKYSQDFQRRLRGEPVQVVHSLQGRVAAAKNPWMRRWPLRATTLESPAFRPFRMHSPLRHDPDKIWPIASKDLAELERIRFSSVLKSWSRIASARRFAFASCLAAWSTQITWTRSRHFEPEKAARRASIPLTPGSRLETLLEATRRVSHKCPEGPVKPRESGSSMPSCGAAASAGILLSHRPNGRRQDPVFHGVFASPRRAPWLAKDHLRPALPEHHHRTERAHPERNLRQSSGAGASQPGRCRLRSGGATAIEVPETPRQRLAAENWGFAADVTTSVRSSSKALLRTGPRAAGNSIVFRDQ